MFAFWTGLIVGLLLADYINLRLNTILGQRVLKNAQTLKNYGLDKYKMFYEDIRERRSK